MDSRAIFQNKFLRVFFAILATLLWGSAFPLVKIGFGLFGIEAGQPIIEVLFAGYRFLASGLIIFCFAAISRQNLRLPRGRLKNVFWLGLLTTALQYTFFYIGLANTTAVKGAILNSTSVFFVFVLAHFFLAGDRLNKRKMFGLAMGFAGVVIVNYSPALLTFHFSLTGEGSMLISQLSGAAGAIYLKKISNSVQVVVLTAYQMIFGALLLILPAGLKTGFWPFHASPQAFLLLTYLSFLSAVAFSLWNSLIKYNPVGQISIFKFLIPVFGVILASLLAREAVSLVSLAALTTVSAGIIMVNAIDYWEGRNRRFVSDFTKG